MRVLALVVACGCSTIFGLEPPTRRDGGPDLLVDAPPIDAIDAPVSDALPACFSDDFNNNSLDARWSIILPTSPHLVREQNQRLELVMAPNVASSNGVALDVVNSELTMEVDFVAPPANGNTSVSFGLVLNADSHVVFTYNNSTLITSVANGGSAQQTMRAFDPMAHRQWQIKISGAPSIVTLSARTSGNWVELDNRTITFPVAQSLAGMSATSVATGNPSPGTAVFDNFYYAWGGCAP